MKPLNETRLVVRKDSIEGTPSRSWRLSWDSGPDSNSFVNETSTVTGQPFFQTMRAAIFCGEYRYGMTAVRAEY